MAASGRLPLVPRRTTVRVQRDAPRQSQRAAIFVLEIDSGVESDVTVNFAGMNLNPLWTPDGGHLLFTTDRLNPGSRPLVALAMRGGTPVGSPTVVQPDFKDSFVGFTRAGVLFYQHHYGGGQHVFAAPAGGTGRVEDKFFGYSPSPSPDGKWIAFAKPGPKGPEVGIRSFDTGEERFFPREHTGNALSALAPRQQRLRNSRSDGGDGGSFYSVNIGTGGFTKLLPVHSPQFRRRHGHGRFR